MVNAKSEASVKAILPTNYDSSLRTLEEETAGRARSDGSGWW